MIMKHFTQLKKNTFYECKLNKGKPNHKKKKINMYTHTFKNYFGVYIVQIL